MANDGNVCVFVDTYKNVLLCFRFFTSSRTHAFKPLNASIHDQIVEAIFYR